MKKSKRHFRKMAMWNRFMIVIGGDGLIDLIDCGEGIYKSYAGGSSLNCAITASLLGSDVSYISNLSSDSNAKINLSFQETIGRSAVKLITQTT